MKPPANILVIGPTWLGDTILSIPVLSNLRAAFPSARLHYLGAPGAAAILAGHPDLDELLVRTGAAVRDIREAARFRRTEMDWALVLSNSFRGALLAYASGARNRTGYSRDGRALLLTDPVPFRSGAARHQMDEYLVLLEHAGVAIMTREPRIGISGEALSFADALWNEHGIRDDEPVVGIQPGARFGATKLWPADRFAAVADRLAEVEGARVILFGSREEAQLTTSIAGLTKTEPVNLAGRDSLSVLPGILKRLDAFLTGDTGPMHAAASVGTPVVALFGPTDPGHTGPLGDSHTVLCRNLFCSPCFLKRCPYGHECMEEMGVDEVVEAVREKLHMRSASRAQTEPAHG